MPFSPVLVVEVEDTILRPAILVGNVEAEWQILFRILVEIVGDVVLVDVVLVSVVPVLEDYVVDELLFQCPSEIIN